VSAGALRLRGRDPGLWGPSADMCAAGAPCARRWSNRCRRLGERVCWTVFLEQGG